MIELPIGEKFDAFVDWLKQSFKGFFDLVSDILDFSITFLENTLLLNSETVYASVLFGLLLALVAGLGARRVFGPKRFLPLALGVACLFGLSEGWRIGTLNQKVDAATAAEMESDFAALRAGLEESAPEDDSEVEALLEHILEALPESDDRGSALFKARDSVEDALREIRRARDYEDVFDALDEALPALRDAEVDLDAERLAELQSARNRYYSLMLIEESDRLLDDFREVSEADDDAFERRAEFLRMRTYTELNGMLRASKRFYADTDEDLSKLSEAADSQLRKLNPRRLAWYPPAATTLLLALVAWLIAGRTMVVFTVVGLFLILSMQMWIPTIETLALVLSATLFALLLGIPVGIGAARSKVMDRGTRPILDFMQTMPAFVYLIPAVIFFGLGKVPGAMATLIFAMPPAVRLTSLGIRQVPAEVVEAARAFGATDRQLLFKAQLPIAMPTILAGVNQTIMLALSMVVIAGMIGAGGLGAVVLSGITQMKLGLGFEGGIAVVILAIYLDRVTQALGTPKSTPQP